jgi:hypothetical protein
MGANPTGLDREGRRDIYFFIHNVYANFFKDSLDYFSLHLYPRFEYKVVGTYDKAVEYLQKQCQYGRETDKPNNPALILNPSGDFDLADGNAGGKQLWRFPNLAPGLVRRIFDPVYKDDDVEINVGFIRIQGDLELIMLLNSFYEYCDLKMLFMQIFGGYERWIYPQFFSTFIILPEELVNYQYTNEYTGATHTLDWANAGAYEKLVKTIAKNELVIPCSIKPIYKLTAFSDASQRYGGADLAEWKLGATIRYEIEVPAFLVLHTDFDIKDIPIKVKAGSTYSTYDYASLNDGASPPMGADSSNEVPQTYSDYNINITLGDSTCSESFVGDYEFHTRYYHIVSQVEADSTSDLVITLPEEVTDLNAVIINSKYGQLTYGDHYTFSCDGLVLTIKRKTVDYDVDWVIEIYFYKRHG